MNVLHALSGILYVISSLLLYPVMLFLVLVFGYTLYAFGQFLAEASARRRMTLQPEAFLPGFLGGVTAGRPAPPADARLPPGLRRFLASTSERMRPADSHAGTEIAYCLRSEEERLGREVDRLRIVVKVGPSLGLLGTLIPMGTALAALAGGNLEGMANNMIIAFTTTVVGLAAGTLAYVMTAAKARWTAEELTLLAYVADRLEHAVTAARTPGAAAVSERS
ncbi:MAG: MotA/TolQ/ExbB proton channel family protein [Planctomycetes bacterium]|nr:MotA/TolQ/ExbB proton channel family protein [Planctomycetota bacterium]